MPLPTRSLGISTGVLPAVSAELPTVKAYAAAAITTTATKAIQKRFIRSRGPAYPAAGMTQGEVSKLRLDTVETVSHFVEPPARGFVMKSFLKSFFALGLLAAASVSAAELNVYSHRHYDSDAILFKQFTKETGIKVNVVKGSADQLIQRLVSEGKIRRPICCSRSMLGVCTGPRRPVSCSRRSPSYWRKMFRLRCVTPRDTGTA